jgi:hypothetical protein
VYRFNILRSIGGASHSLGLGVGVPSFFDERIFVKNDIYSTGQIYAIDVATFRVYVPYRGGASTLLGHRNSHSDSRNSVDSIGKRQ